jgi:hypothetical protein
MTQQNLGGWKRPENVPQQVRAPAGVFCRVHNLTYDGPAGAPCPACDLLQEYKTAQAEIRQLRAVNQKLIKENRSLQGITDVKSQLSGAARVMETEDMLWIKEKLYEYKLTRKLVLKTTHYRKDGQQFANGFVSQVPGGEPDARVMTSIGGVALAAAYDEACSLHGTGRAMGLMADSLWELLPGGHRDG